MEKTLPGSITVLSKITGTDYKHVKEDVDAIEAKNRNDRYVTGIKSESKKTDTLTTIDESKAATQNSRRDGRETSPVENVVVEIGKTNDTSETDAERISRLRDRGSNNEPVVTTANDLKIQVQNVHQSLDDTTTGARTSRVSDSGNAKQTSNKDIQNASEKVTESSHTSPSSTPATQEKADENRYFADKTNQSKSTSIVKKDESDEQLIKPAERSTKSEIVTGARSVADNLPTREKSPYMKEYKDGDSQTSTQVASLKSQIESLTAELESQTKWEAFRLQEALSAQAMLEKRDASRSAAELERKLLQEKASAVAKVRQEAEKSYAKQLSNVKREMDEKFADRVQRTVQEKERQLRTTIKGELTTKAKEETDKRAEELGKIRGLLDALQKSYQNALEQRELAHKSSQLAATSFAMKEKVEEGDLSNAEIEKLLDTETGKAIRAALPLGAAPSNDELKTRFVAVGKEGRKAALLPEEKGGSVWAYVLAVIASKIKIGVDQLRLGKVPDEPKTNEERIRKAERLVAEGHLSEGIAILSSVNGFAGEIVADWLTEAKMRLAASQAAKLLQTDAVLTQIALSSSKVKSS